MFIRKFIAAISFVYKNSLQVKTDNNVILLIENTCSYLYFWKCLIICICFNPTQNVELILTTVKSQLHCPDVLKLICVPTGKSQSLTSILKRCFSNNFLGITNFKKMLNFTEHFKLLKLLYINKVTNIITRVFLEGRYYIFRSVFSAAVI